MVHVGASVARARARNWWKEATKRLTRSTGTLWGMSVVLRTLMILKMSLKTVGLEFVEIYKSTDLYRLRVAPAILTIRTLINALHFWSISMLLHQDVPRP